jgi:leader peptidase (prepilin peptidase)/N-methyltransferase
METGLSQIVGFTPVMVILTFVIGLSVGSFLNVCIYRIPRDGSVASPKRSYCPHCEHSLSALDNVPVFSYIFLRGKCRYCKGKISPRYMIVELLTAVLFVLMLHRSAGLYQNPWHIILELIATCIFAALLIAISFIDLDFTIIPDRIVYSGIIAGLLFAVIMSVLQGDYKIFMYRILGAVIGAVIIIIIAVVGSAVFRKDAMGGGDVKLMGMIGAFLGAWPHIPLTLILASFLGSIIGIALIIANKKKMGSAIPFGPFLSLGALISLLYGEKILSWYQGIMGL